MVRALAHDHCLSFIIMQKYEIGLTSEGGPKQLNNCIKLNVKQVGQDT